MQKLGSHHHYLTSVFQNCHVLLAGNSSKVSVSLNLLSTSELEELTASAITLGNFRTTSWPSYFQTTVRFSHSFYNKIANRYLDCVKAEYSETLSDSSTGSVSRMPPMGEDLLQELLESPLPDANDN